MTQFLVSIEIKKSKPSKKTSAIREVLTEDSYYEVDSRRIARSFNPGMRRKKKRPGECLIRQEAIGANTVE